MLLLFAPVGHQAGASTTRTISGGRIAYSHFGGFTIGHGFLSRPRTGVITR